MKQNTFEAAFLETANNITKQYRRNLSVMPLPSIWLNKPLLIDSGTTRQLSEGNRVCIEDGELIDCAGKPTHEITMLMGRENSDFEIHAIDLKTSELIRIKL